MSEYLSGAITGASVMYVLAILFTAVLKFADRMTTYYQHRLDIIMDNDLEDSDDDPLSDEAPGERA
jgi:hypothetical protein